MRYARGLILAGILCCALGAMLSRASGAEETPAADATTFEVIKTDDVDGVDLMEDFRHAVFAHQGAGRVSVWDIVERKEVATFDTPSPRCVLARGTCVYVGNDGESLVTVYDGAKEWQKVAEVKLPLANIATLSAPGGKAFKGQLLALCEVDLKQRQLVVIDTKTKVARELGGRAEHSGAAVDFDGKFFIRQGAGGSPSRAIEDCKSWPMLLAGRNVDLAQRQYDTLPILRQVQSGPFWIAGNRICKGVPPVPMGDVRDQFVIPDRRKQLAYIFPNRTRLEAVELKGTLASVGKRNIYFPEQHGRFIEMNPHVTCFYDFLSFAVTGDDDKLRVYSYDGKQKLVWTLTVDAFEGDDAPMQKDASKVVTTKPEEKPAPKKPAADDLRTWTDATGKFKVEASYVEIAADRIKLKRADGRELLVPLAQLSVADKTFLQSHGITAKKPAVAAEAPAVAESPTPMLPVVKSDLSASAQLISTTYGLDKDLADRQFKDKLVEVSGIVFDPRNRPVGDEVSVLVTWPGGEGDYVHCRLHRTANPHSLDLWPGQTVKLVGLSLGNPVKPMFDDCQITEIGPPSKITKVKAQELIDAFTKDEDAANKTYHGQALLIEGIVAKIDKEDQFLYIAGKPDAGGKDLLIAASWGRIHRDLVEATDKLEVGQAVTLRAICGELDEFSRGIPLEFWSVK